MKRICHLTLLSCLPLLTVAQSLTESAPYVLSNTEVLNLPAPTLKRDYELFVSLPTSYHDSSRRYPVVFVTDANYAFPLIRSIAARVGHGQGGIEEFILVGLSYAKGDTPEYSRRRDYTPNGQFDPSLKSDMLGRAPAFGQNEDYKRFIASAVFPLVAKHYRADMSRKVFVGHSYGSLLGTQALLTEPTMFQHYVLGSPSYWYGNKVMFEREKAYAASHKDLKANIFFAVGAFETVKPGSKDSRYNETNDLVADMREFERRLKSHKYPGLRVQSKVLDDEDHLSVAPNIITRGLKWALPGN